MSFRQKIVMLYILDALNVSRVGSAMALFWVYGGRAYCLGLAECAWHRPDASAAEKALYIPDV